jgi:Bromodomain
MSAGQAAAARRCVLAVAASAQGAIFGSPVGPEAPGYRRVVKRPMDLGTVAAKLQAGGYATTGAATCACSHVLYCAGCCDAAPCAVFFILEPDTAD